jgi:phage shock protein C
MNCIACGKEINQGARFCSNCGQSVAAQGYTQTYSPPNAQPYAAQMPPQRPQLFRPRYGRVFGGVCAGLAQHFGWDLVLVRILLCVIVFFGCGTPIIAYLIAWIAIPNEPFYFTAQTYAQPVAPTNTHPNTHPGV